MSNILKHDYEAILNRMKQFLKVRADSKVADELEVSPSALSDFRKRGSFPAERIIQFCLKHGLSINWLLTGKGEMNATETHRGDSPRLEELAKKLGIIYHDGSLEAKAKVMGIIDAVHDDIMKKMETARPDFTISREEKKRKRKSA